MTPKIKAMELVAEFITETLRMPTLSNKQAKQCALICVGEMIQELAYGKTNSTSFEQEADYHSRIEYWNQVKTEIEKL